MLARNQCIDVQALGCDFLVCSSYKFCGPHLGVLRGRRQLLDELTACKVRCASDASPEKWEIGTPQTELLAGLAAWVDHYAWLGGLVSDSEYAARPNRSDLCLRRRLRGASGDAPDRRHQGHAGHHHPRHHQPQPGRRAGADSVDDPRSRVACAVAERLARAGICVWSGHNYAYEVVRHLGIDETTGVVRIGLAHYNTEEEVDETLTALEGAVR